MNLVQQKNETAFNILVDRYVNVLHAFVYRMCQNQQEAEDLVQETFLRVWQRSQTWRPNIVRFTTWVHQIARNLCIDSFRTAKPKIDSAVEIEEQASSISENDVWLTQHIRDAIGMLPERQRTALILCQVQGWSQPHAAQVLGTTVEAVEALLGRARRTLREGLYAYRESIKT